MVQNQPLPRRKLVISLVQKQHLAELNAFLQRLSAVEIGQILSALKKK
jgi:magnesium transporter